MVFSWCHLFVLVSPNVDRHFFGRWQGEHKLRQSSFETGSTVFFSSACSATHSQFSRSQRNQTPFHHMPVQSERFSIRTKAGPIRLDDQEQAKVAGVFCVHGYFCRAKVAGVFDEALLLDHSPPLPRELKFFLKQARAQWMLRAMQRSQAFLLCPMLLIPGNCRRFFFEFPFTGHRPTSMVSKSFEEIIYMAS